jgi:hypothetical protein
MRGFALSINGTGALRASVICGPVFPVDDRSEFPGDKWIPTTVENLKPVPES